MAKNKLIEFLGICESVNNPDFNYGEFAIIRSQAGLNNYKISVKEWNERTNAIGLKATTGRYGGTFAHIDIAFEFDMWISAEFKVYLIQEYNRIKQKENNRLQLDWNQQRTLQLIMTVCSVTFYFDCSYFEGYKQLILTVYSANGCD